MIRVDFRNRKPLYQQLVENIEELAVRGLLLPDSQLPSVRALAMELAINPNTIQRAYGELEKRGVIYSLPGRGSFIGNTTESLVQSKRQTLLEKIEALLQEAFLLGISEEEIYTRIRRALADAPSLRPPQAPPPLAARPTEQESATKAANLQQDAVQEGSDA